MSGRFAVSCMAKPSTQQPGQHYANSQSTVLNRHFQIPLKINGSNLTTTLNNTSTNGSHPADVATSSSISLPLNTDSIATSQHRHYVTPPKERTSQLLGEVSAYSEPISHSGSVSHADAPLAVSSSEHLVSSPLIDSPHQFTPSISSDSYVSSSSSFFLSSFFFFSSSFFSSSIYVKFLSIHFFY